MTRTSAAFWLAAATVAACTPPPQTAQSRANQALVSACRQRADEVYRKQNRASLYTQDDRFAPESGLYNSGITTRGLAERFAWDTQVSDCVRSQSATIPQGQVPQAAPAPAIEPVPH